MRRISFGLLYLLVLITPTWAQNQVQLFSAYSPGQQNLTWMLQQNKGDGFELWYFDGTAGDKLDLISAKLRYQGQAGKVTAGLYTRLQSGQISRYGISGTVTIGQSKGWLLNTGPYFLFRQRGKNEFSDWGIWFPNARITRPVSERLRAGLGLADTAIEGKKVNLIVGPYGQYQVNKATTIQVRIGRVMAPTTQEGQWQLFSGVQYVF